MIRSMYSTKKVIRIIPDSRQQVIQIARKRGPRKVISPECYIDQRVGLYKVIESTILVTEVINQQWTDPIIKLILKSIQHPFPTIALAGIQIEDDMPVRIFYIRFFGINSLAIY